MAPRKLSPSVLAALGLSACVDGCEPEDLPIVGRLFEDGQGPEDTQPCLNVPAPVPPPVGPCLDMVADTGLPKPAPSPSPAPEEVQACLLIVLPDPVTQPAPVGPCLKIAQPPRVGPCLRMAPVRPLPQPSPSPVEPAGDPPEDDGAGDLDESSTRGDDVLAALIRDGILAEDVVARLSETDP